MRIEDGDEADGESDQKSDENRLSGTAKVDGFFKFNARGFLGGGVDVLGGESVGLKSAGVNEMDGGHQFIGKTFVEVFNTTGDELICKAGHERMDKQLPRDRAEEGDPEEEQQKADGIGKMKEIVGIHKEENRGDGGGDEDTDAEEGKDESDAGAEAADALHERVGRGGGDLGHRGTVTGPLA